MNVLIADDEPSILEGLQYIIDWNELGFSICATAVNGVDALEKILKLQPDLVLMDIRMPRMSGIEVIENARRNGFGGRFIILSGMSDFKYAQKAMQLQTDFYLTKPIDEDELEDAVKTLKERILQDQAATTHLEKYREKARDPILKDLLMGNKPENGWDLSDLKLDAPIYQVIFYESYNQEAFHLDWSFEELFHTADSSSLFDSIHLDDQNVILLKGAFSMDRFDNMLRHYQENPQKGSPLESLFLMCGRRVQTPDEIHLSYEDAKKLTSRRFFCSPLQHILSYEDLPQMPDTPGTLDSSLAETYSRRLTDLIQSHNRAKTASVLQELQEMMFTSGCEILNIKHFLAEVYLQVKQKLQHLYGTLDIPAPAAASAITYIENKFYLYEIMQFMSQQFEIIMNAVAPASASSIIDDILSYIEHNYKESLKLESIAPLFGYNSSYLGKLFSSKTGTTFNSWLDQVRIRHSKDLLLDPSIKVYEVSERVGYKSVDYFHKKFKKYVGESPAEYRKHLL